MYLSTISCFFFFQAEDGIRDLTVTGVQTCALPISRARDGRASRDRHSAVSAPAGGRRDAVRAPAAVWRAAAGPDALERARVLAAGGEQLLGPQRHRAPASLRASLHATASARETAPGGRDSQP